jgi:hypothetical protein
MLAAAIAKVIMLDTITVVIIKFDLIKFGAVTAIDQPMPVVVAIEFTIGTVMMITILKAKRFIIGIVVIIMFGMLVVKA